MLREVTTSEGQSQDRSQGFYTSKIYAYNGYHVLNTENIPSVVLSTLHTSYL